MKRTYPNNLLISFIINFYSSHNFFNITKNHIQVLIISLKKCNKYKPRKFFENHKTSQINMATN